MVHDRARFFELRHGCDLSFKAPPGVPHFPRSMTNEKNIFLNHFAGWAATDIFIKNNSFFANGLLDANKQDNYLTALKNQKSAKQNIQNIIPHNTSMLLMLSFSNTKMLAFGMWKKRDHALRL